MEQSTDDQYATPPTTTATAIVRLSEDDQGLAAGQFTAFYREADCIGSGIILESWDDHGFPICPRALELAKLSDKSKLGPPVKIFNLLTSPIPPLTEKSSSHVVAAVPQKVRGIPRILPKWSFGSWQRQIAKWLGVL